MRWLALETLTGLLQTAVCRVALSSLRTCHGGQGLLLVLSVRWV
jgi:hypothetical protein